MSSDAHVMHAEQTLLKQTSHCHGLRKNRCTSRRENADDPAFVFVVSSSSLHSNVSLQHSLCLCVTLASYPITGYPFLSQKHKTHHKLTIMRYFIDLQGYLFCLCDVDDDRLPSQLYESRRSCRRFTLFRWEMLTLRQMLVDTGARTHVISPRKQ